MMPLSAWSLLSLSCVTLDPLLPFFNNIPCSEVDETTCSLAEDNGSRDPYWDKVCLSCEEPYDWQQDYEWREKTLDRYDPIPAVDPDKVQALTIATEDGAELDAYFLEASGAFPERSQTTLLFNHGRFANIEHYQPYARLLYALGFNLVIWDYRGFGKTLPETTTTIAEVMSDSLIVLDKVRELSPDPDKIIAYGLSIGGIPNGEMVQSGLPCAQIWDSPYVSVTQKVETNLSLSLPGSFLTSGLAENHLKLSESALPALILKAGEDDRIHPEEIQSLYDALPEDTPKRMVEVAGAEHGLGFGGSVPAQGLGAFEDILMSFLEELAPECLSD